MNIRIVCLVAPVVLVFSCGGPQQELQPLSVLDTPEGAYNQGMVSYLEGDMDEAWNMFTRSRELAETDKTPYAPAHEGLGLIHLAWNDLDAAEEEMKTSIDIDGSYANARVGLGRIRTAQSRYDEAIKEFDRAIKTKTRSGVEQPYAYKHAHLYKGKTLELMNEFDLAEESYKNAIDVDPNFMEAQSNWERLQTLRRASAGQTDVMKRIAASSAITRAELAAILVEQLPLDRIYRHRQAEITTPMDVKSSWARGYCDKVLSCGILELYPSGEFLPEEYVARADLAFTMQKILVATFQDPSLETKYVGEMKADYTDLSPQSPFYNAVRLMTSRGIMKGRMDGSFGVGDTVPGSEALEIIGRLRAELQ